MGKLPRWKNSSIEDMKSYVRENIVGFGVGFKNLDVSVDIQTNKWVDSHIPEKRV